ncbi:MAG: thiamine diphosphokinase [Eggerthellaceae bacterium]|nr:thiamine diphosphokinase [Eggerthellaceae bacterium]
MEHDPKTCALVAASDFNAPDFEIREANGQFDFIIAVDGGFAHLHELGVVPDLTIGDFDSLGYVPEGEDVIVHPVHKDKSDLELVLDYALEHGLESAVVYGALGGRLDHSVANLQMCARFAEAGLDLLLVGDDMAVKILVGPGEYGLPDCDRGTVSVFSAVDESHGVTERGLEYPLENATLTNRTTLGLSNELIGEPASVSIEQGTLFIFHPLDNG